MTGLLEHDSRLLVALNINYLWSLCGKGVSAAPSSHRSSLGRLKPHEPRFDFVTLKQQATRLSPLLAQLSNSESFSGYKC